MSATPPAAVVFAYHDVGARCLRVLLAHGIEVPLVITHPDDPGENRWFERVSDVAESHRLPWIAPGDPNAADVVARVASLAPAFLFSFYYRKMLAAPMLATARRAALNMHGSLLPKYRGRAPVNWAVLHGERETGATLHHMTVKPDAGDIVDRQRVPIGPEDTAAEVLGRVATAAAIVLDRALPSLVAGTAPRHPNDLAAGSYFGGRTPEDGRIDWSWPARRVHDLVRAVAPPFPGAFGELASGRLSVLRTRLVEAPRGMPASPGVFVVDGRAYARTGDAGCVEILDAAIDGERADAAAIEARLASRR